MCGIVGFIAASTATHTLFAMDAALRALGHRGPDYEDSYSENRGSYRVSLGHRRLSIIDLSAAGHQPMHAAGVWLIYNGEVYNYEALRDEHLSGVKLKSSSDTEVVLHLYLKFGEEFVKLLNGDFAMAIFDRNENKVLLYRDRMGVKPLYIYQNQGVFAFASEIKAFKAAGLPLSLDEDGVGNYLIFKYSPGQRTLFKEVGRLKPAHVLRFDLTSGSVAERSFWELSASVVPYKGSYSDAQCELRAMMKQAVEMRLVGDVPVANYLSGGLDSSIIATYLKDGGHTHYCAVKNQSDLKAEGTTSDGYYARKLAAEWGLDLRQISIGLDELNPENLGAAIHACDDLIADGSIIPAMLIAAEASKDHRVVLSGMGADELFLGYNGHFLMRLTEMVTIIPGAKGILAPAFRRIDAGKGPFKAYRRYLQKWGNNVGSTYQAAQYSVVGDVASAKSCFNGKSQFEAFLDPYFSGGADPFEQLLHFEQENFLVKNLHYLDRSSMAYSLESRVPFLDHQLVSFAAGLPLEYKLDWKLKSKKILKDAYHKELPTFITKRRKAGFGMPLRSLLINKEVLDLFLPLDFFAGFQFFNVDQVKHIIQAHRAGRQDQSALIYALISFRIWYLENFG